MVLGATTALWLTMVGAFGACYHCSKDRTSRYLTPGNFVRIFRTSYVSTCTRTFLRCSHLFSVLFILLNTSIDIAFIDNKYVTLYHSCKHYKSNVNLRQRGSNLCPGAELGHYEFVDQAFRLMRFRYIDTRCKY
ncbi:uncharacterized protein C8R40DRAFT_903203 [Lentinula edodes]|uniref:uncharacterized protein n=1 Tax=Lentinula edodes TaxID=5353 RepID=UPI001E8E044F|nr:uncharacterized protein C8R40DRAFT_903203 [Lentinula edodes]KAH7877553.1 hypothetical protein C8R40DRAFT_903203 [Lentinula edodes]